MTVVIGTAGHIDHGKTTLLRALTGIDADRLPEEQRRGMTIDVGYAHLPLDDGRTIDFVDVPGHDKLVGNMLVGAGEIDAAMLVVAADDGPRAQTREHLALLDALGIAHGLAVITKIDAVPVDRVDAVVEQVTALLASTSLAGSPVVVASAVTASGLDDVAAVVRSVADRVHVQVRPPTLAIDRVFSVKGRGIVVTGTLRGGRLARGDTLRIVPAGDRTVRIREVQVHGTPVDHVDGGGRTALNLASVEVGELRRGMVLTADPAVVASDRALVALDGTVADRSRGRLHVGTAAVDASIGRAGRDALELPDGRQAGLARLAEPVALRAGDRFVVRRGHAVLPVGGTVLDTSPPRGVSRRRQTAARVAALEGGGPEARLELHGIVGKAIAPDLAAAAETAAIDAVRAGQRSATAIRSAIAAVLRRGATVRRDAALQLAADVVDRVVASGRLVRSGDAVALPGALDAGPDPALLDAMAHLVALLSVPAPPPLADAARSVGCPAEGIRQLERDGRIVVLEPDLAYAAATYRDLTAQAVDLASREPLTPARLRDATGTSRRYVMAMLEDLDRRAVLRRTPAGHVLGPKAPTAVTR